MAPMRLVLLCALLPGVAAVSAQPLPAPIDRGDLAGVYRCDGVNGVGDPYRGMVIIAKHEDTYRMQWRFPGEPPAVGLGIRQGDVLAVSYVGSRPGVVLYDIVGERLVGRWTVFGAGGFLGRESLTRLHGLGDPAMRPPEVDRPAADSVILL
jgi:hypothetical protein